MHALHYPLVQCIKYRRTVLDSKEIVDVLKQKIHDISATFEVGVLNIEWDPAQFHMLFTSKPTLDIPRYMNTLKTITSREIQPNFPTVKETLWKGAFWSRSYFLTTTGQVTLEPLKNYVETQGRV